MSRVDFVKVLQSKKLLGRFLDISTRPAWVVLWKAADALPPTDDDLPIFRQCTGRDTWPVKPAREVHVISGVRGGKTENVAARALYEAVHVPHKLSRGEKGYVLCVSVTKKQAGLVKGYLSSYFDENEYYKPFVVRETADELELSNRIVIACLSSDFRSLRGFTGVAGIVDEMSYMDAEGARPAIEVLRALRGRLASTLGRLYTIGSPYAARGPQFDIYKKHWGRESDLFVWKASSLTMNPTLSQEMVDQAYEEDPEGAKADFGGDFRAGIESYISRDVLEALVVTGRYELPPCEGIAYVAFVDPAGGSGQDSMTVCVGHKDGAGIVVLDALREVKPPFSPDQVCGEFAGLLRSYRVNRVRGDRYAGEWPRERFRLHGIEYEICPKSKSELYKEGLPSLNAGRVEFLDHPRLVHQLSTLERRTARGGRDSIDHPPHGHDDVANACMGVVNQADVWRGAFVNLERCMGGTDERVVSDCQVSEGQRAAAALAAAGWRGTVPGFF